MSWQPGLTKVYVVTYEPYHDNSQICGAWTSEKAAQWAVLAALVDDVSEWEYELDLDETIYVGIIDEDHTDYSINFGMIDRTYRITEVAVEF